MRILEDRRYRAGRTVPAGKTNSRKEIENWICSNSSALERRLECAIGNEGGSEPDNRRGEHQQRKNWMCVMNYLHWREDWNVLQAMKVEASQITRGDGHQHDYYRCYSIWGKAMWGHQHDSLIYNWLYLIESDFQVEQRSFSNKVAWKGPILQMFVCMM